MALPARVRFKNEQAMTAAIATTSVASLWDREGKSLIQSQHILYIAHRKLDPFPCSLTPVIQILSSLGTNVRSDVPTKNGQAHWS